MSGPSLKDFEPECFTLEKYVEKLAQLNPDTGLGPLSKSKKNPFDPEVLLQSFEESIHTLQELAEKNQRRVDKLEHVCVKQEREHSARIKDLETNYSDAFNEFQGLEDRITYVSTKVVHLGDQLESSNNRRVRAMEAQNLMNHLTEFELKAKPPLPVFTDPSRKLEAADLVFKLQSLSSELPSTQKYKAIRSNIATKYAEIESQLVDEFIEAQRSLDTRRMKQYAQALQPFSTGSQRVIENYIHHNMPHQQFSSTEEMFTQVERICKKTHDQMVEVFDNPDVVMTKFIQTIIDKVLQKHIDNDLRLLATSNSDKERYLKRLNELYERTMKLKAKLSEYEMSIDPVFLAKLIRVNLFSKYLSTYAETEIQHLKARSTRTLNEFQDSVGIARKTGASRLTIPAGRDPEETYVSQEVCTGVLHEAKGAIRRAKALLIDRDLSKTVREIYFVVLEKLCSEHFHTALDIAQTVDQKTSPIGYFCMVVGNINNNMHLVEKLFREDIMPRIHYPAIANACVEKKRSVTSNLEAKIESGIERTITGMNTHVRTLLSSYQKKTDYKPEVLEVTEGTQACNRAVSYIKECCRILRESLDGKNLEVVLLELGVRLHRVVYDHVHQYSINEAGAMIIICDMNEYRRAIKGFKIPFLDELFESLQTLCNIFVVKGENLSQIFSEEPYVNFDRSVLQSMIGLRADSKTSKLQKLFNN